MLADIGQWMLVTVATVDVVIFIYIALRRARSIINRLTGILIALTCLLPAALWGGQEMNWWIVTPAFGRPAATLPMIALLWMGVAILRRRHLNL